MNSSHVNIHQATASSLFEEETSDTVKDKPSAFFSFVGSIGNYQKNEHSSSPTCNHPFLQAKLMIIHKNPSMFRKLMERLRDARICFSRNLQEFETHSFLAELKIVEMREEIKSHALVLNDGSMSLLRSSFFGVSKSMWSSEFCMDDASTGAGEGDSRGNLNHGGSVSPPRSRMSFRLFLDSARLKSQELTPTIMLPPSVQQQLKRPSKNLSDLINDEECCGSTASGSIDDVDTLASSSIEA